MQSTNTTISRLACTVGLALTAVATGAAGGSDANGSNEPVCNARAQACMTAAEYRALTIRSEALNREYGLGTN
jgi:hypothetical protein